MDRHWLEPLECAGASCSPVYRALQDWRLELELILQRFGCYDVCGSVLDACLQLACDLRVRPIVLAVAVLTWLLTVTFLLRSVVIRFIRWALIRFSSLSAGQHCNPVCTHRGPGF